MQEQLYQATNGQSEEEEKIKNTYNEVKSQCKQLQKQCNNYETEVDRLSSKLKKMHAEVGFYLYSIHVYEMDWTQYVHFIFCCLLRLGCLTLGLFHKQTLGEAYFLTPNTHNI